MRKQFFVSVIVLAGVFVLSLAASTSAGEIQRKLAAESAIEQIAKRGVIRVGMDVFVPWAMANICRRRPAFRPSTLPSL